METIEQRISYLRGLANGLEINESSKEGRLIQEMLGVFEDMSKSMNDIQWRLEDYEDYIDAVDIGHTLSDLAYDDDEGHNYSEYYLESPEETDNDPTMPS